MADYTVKGEMTLGVTSFLRNMAKAEAAIAKAERDLNRLDKTLDDLEQREIDIRANVDTTVATKAVNRLNAELNKIRNRTVRVNAVQTGSTSVPGNSTSTATTNVGTRGVPSTLAQLAAVNAAQNKINKQSTIVNVLMRGHDAVNSGLDSVSRAMYAVPSSFLFSSFTALATMAIPAVTVAAGTLAGGLSPLATTGFGALAGVGAVVPAMLSIKSTMGQLDKAQKALAEAKTTEEIAAAHDNLRKVLEGMPPGMEEVINKYNELREAGKNFGSSFRGETFDLFNSSMDLALSTMEKVEPVSKQAIRGFQDVINSAQRRIDTGEWDSFYGYLERNSRGFIRTWGDVVMNFATGAGNMLVAFDPLTQDFNRGVLEMSRNFREWSETLSTNQGFQDFINYVQENGPKVWNTVKEISETLWDLGVALAPIGMQLIEFAGGVAEFINDFREANPVIYDMVVQGTALGIMLSSLTTPLGLVLSLASKTGGGLGLLGGAFRALNGVVSGSASMMRGTNDTWNRFSINTGVATERMTGSAAAGSRAMTVMGGLGRAIPVVGAAVSAAAIGWGIYKQRQQEAAAETERNANQLRQGGAAAEEVNQKIAWMKNTFGEGAIKSDALSNALKKQWEAMSPLQQAQSKVAEWTNTLSYRQQEQGRSSEGARIAAERLKYWREQEKTVTDNLATATQSLTDRINENTTASQNNVNASLAASNAEIAFRQSTDSLAEAQSHLSTLQRSGTATEAELRRATDNVTLAQNNLTQSVINAANKARDLAVSQNSQKSESERARIGNDAYIRSLEIMASQASGPTQQAIWDLITAARNVPQNVTFRVDADTAAAMSKIRELSIAKSQAGLSSVMNFMGGRAKGGSIWEAGTHLVGEQGPELRFLNRGDYIATAAQTKQILAAQKAYEGGGHKPSAPVATMYAQASAPAPSGGSSSRDDLASILEAVRGSEGGTQTIILQVDGREMARVVNKANARNGAR